MPNIWTQSAYRAKLTLKTAQQALFGVNTSFPMVSLTALNGMMDDWLASLKSA
jgi:hypothetical protein